MVQAVQTRMDIDQTVFLLVAKVKLIFSRYFILLHLHLQKLYRQSLLLNQQRFTNRANNDCWPTW